MIYGSVQNVCIVVVEDIPKDTPRCTFLNLCTLWLTSPNLHPSIAMSAIALLLETANLRTTQSIQ